MATVVQAARPPRTVRIGGRRIALIGPRITDPRLHVAAVVVTVQVLGETVLKFDLSITQILVSLATCALIELAVVLRRRDPIVWPASALLTGNGIALVLRVPGTRHGDWWSARGWWIFAGTAVVAMASKYLIRVDDRPLFNPSNFALVACFLALGPLRASPLDLWWANPGPALTVTLFFMITDPKTAPLGRGVPGGSDACSSPRPSSARSRSSPAARRPSIRRAARPISPRCATAPARRPRSRTGPTSRSGRCPPS